MTRYHISDSGKTAVCKAAPGNCPLGGQHFSSKDTADFYVENTSALPTEDERSVHQSMLDWAAAEVARKYDRFEYEQLKEMHEANDHRYPLPTLDNPRPTREAVPLRKPVTEQFGYTTHKLPAPYPRVAEVLSLWQDGRQVGYVYRAEGSTGWAPVAQPDYLWERDEYPSVTTLSPTDAATLATAEYAAETALIDHIIEHQVPVAMAQTWEKTGETRAFTAQELGDVADQIETDLRGGSREPQRYALETYSTFYDDGDRVMFQVHFQDMTTGQHYSGFFEYTAEDELVDLARDRPVELLREVRQ